MNKLRKRTQDLPNCPKCESSDGIIGVFVQGLIKRKKFLYCNKCKYSVLSLTEQTLKDI